MKKTHSSKRAVADRDTMRKEYDFSGAIRGATAARYAEGSNVVVIDPAVLDVFPDAKTVNDTLRALAPVLRRDRRSKAASPTSTRTTPKSSRDMPA